VSLSHELERLNSKLIIRAGHALEVINSLIEETGAQAVFWNRRYEPLVMARDQSLKKHLKQLAVHVETFDSALLHHPDEVLNKQAQPFQVFTFFWQACLRAGEPTYPRAAAQVLLAPRKWPQSLTVQSLELEPKVDWASGIRREWMPGSPGAHKRLLQFVERSLFSYAIGRNQPGLDGVSRLSPHLHFGEISPNQVWYAAKQALEKLPSNDRKKAQAQVETFLKELGWREFAHYLLYHFPQTPEWPLRGEFKHFPWIEDKGLLRLWQKGQTGYPLVDAGMRQLWMSGWMHNRVRMVVASFLVKDLLLDWRTGAQWFWDTLVDADLANNTLGWQWTAGCGADAVPYFRIFNPLSQAMKFDPHGQYVRRWVPELIRLPDNVIHAPWLADKAVLLEAGVELGRNYPWPIVDHNLARREALAALKSMKEDMARQNVRST
jgi:deoxyribodipyrimidine photo-lyase